MQTNIVKALLAIGLFAILFTACQKEAIVNQGTAPTLPPSNSMAIDFDSFKQSGKTEDITAPFNWAFAASNIAIWHSMLSVQLIIPVTAYREAFNHTAQLNNGTWTWTYDFNPANNPHTATLEAVINNNEVDWSMKISNNSVSNFEWFTGTSKLDGSGGNWSLNKSIEDPSPLLDIEWDKISNTDVAAKFTDPNYNNYIEYGITNGDLNTYYNMYQANNSSLIEVEWNRNSYNGRVKNNQHFGDNEWHCWDSSHQDIDC